jgi:hypothetical protein
MRTSLVRLPSAVQEFFLPVYFLHHNSNSDRGIRKERVTIECQLKGFASGIFEEDCYGWKIQEVLEGKK